MDINLISFDVTVVSSSSFSSYLGGGIDEAIQNICEKIILKYKRPSMSESIFDDSFHIHNNNSKNDNQIKCPC